MTGAALDAAAFLYGMVVAARDRGFRVGVLRAARVPARIVSLGNLAAGGTGKTPAVAAVAERLVAAGRRVAILTRGYGRAGRGLRAAGPGEGAAAWRALGDEPALLRRLLPGVPLVVAADRVAGAREAIRRFGADTLVLDDGFQHRWLARDVDVVLVDAERPLDNGRLLPRGLLREPPAALGRAHVVVLSGDAAPADWTAAAAPLRPWAPGAALAGAVRTAVGWVDVAPPAPGMAPPGALAGRRVVAFAGIARPGRFREQVARLGAEVAAFLPFRDHHPFTEEDLRAIAAAARAHGAEGAVTTEKDAVRLDGMALPEGLRVRALRIALDVVWNAAAFWAAVEGTAPAGEAGP